MKSGNYLLPGNSLLGNHSEMNSVHSYGIAALMRSGFDLTIFGSESVFTVFSTCAYDDKVIIR